MQPSENMKPRAEVTKSAPTHNAQATSAGMMSLPEQMTLMRSRKPQVFRVSTTIGRLSLFKTLRIAIGKISVTMSVLWIMGKHYESTSMGIGRRWRNS